MPKEEAVSSPFEFAERMHRQNIETAYAALDCLEALILGVKPPLAALELTSVRVARARNFLARDCGMDTRDESDRLYAWES
jgi:hypothetical protein